MSARSLDEAVSRLFEAGISSQKVASDVLGVGVGDMHHRSPGIERVRCVMHVDNRGFRVSHPIIHRGFSDKF